MTVNATFIYSECLLYKFIIFWQSTHLLFHSLQVHDLILTTCSRKQVPVNSEDWFSPLWRQQKERRRKCEDCNARTQRGQTAYWIPTPFNAHRLSTSILHLGPCSCWQGVKMCPWAPGQRSNLYKKIL